MSLIWNEWRIGMRAWQQNEHKDFENFLRSAQGDFSILRVYWWPITNHTEKYRVTYHDEGNPLDWKVFRWSIVAMSSA